MTAHWTPGVTNRPSGGRACSARRAAVIAELNGRTADRVRELCQEIHRAGKSESALGALAALVISEFPPRDRITTGLMPLVELCRVASGRSELDRCDRVLGHGGTHTWEGPLVPPF